MFKMISGVALLVALVAPAYAGTVASPGPIPGDGASGLALLAAAGVAVNRHSIAAFLRRKLGR